LAIKAKNNYHDAIEKESMTVHMLLHNPYFVNHFDSMLPPNDNVMMYFLMSLLEQFKMVKYDNFYDFKLLLCEYFLSSFKENNNYNNELSTQ
jgi:hypothetical protein